ncbi:uncharacterized protein LOC143916096 [Arctopsyche grandis]|uniref:uncharacterized protein LOC143916096 n=1 Tax=Arctopsyche grandis TaxID=121162 RepID=UPI00406D8480
MKITPFLITLVSMALAAPQQSDYPTPRTPQKFPYPNNYFLKDLNGGDYPIFSASPTSRVPTGGDYPTFKDPETSSVSTGGDYPQFRDPQTSKVSSMALAAPQQSDYPTPRTPQKFPYPNNYFLKNLNGGDYPTSSASPTSSVPTGGDYPTFKDPQTSSVSTGGDYPQFRDPQTSKVSSMALAAPQQSDYPTPRTPQKFPYPNNYFLKNLNGGDYPTSSASQTSSVPTGGDYPTFKDPQTSRVSTGGDYPQFGDPQSSRVSTGGDYPQFRDPQTSSVPTGGDYPVARAPQRYPNNYFLKDLNI